MHSLAQRLVVLAAVALLAATSALAVAERRETPTTQADALTSAPAPAGWNTAFAGSRGPAGDALRTTCGHLLAPESLGATHPVLPCGARLVFRRGGDQILTEVIDNALVDPGHQLEVTEALAELLDIPEEDTVELEWRFATDASG
ncbi:MAG TPA: hypothetical protein VMN35_05805 [Gaiellaceae bacterium]|nr:hypothetical protein [Gaiellaceae bacterium]